LDNRKFRRMSFNAQVLVSHGDASFVGTVENLSLKGLFVKTDQKIPLNETVNISLSFKGNKGNLSLGLDGRVVRVTEEGIGLKFGKISIDSLESTLNGGESCASSNCQMSSGLCQAAV